MMGKPKGTRKRNIQPFRYCSCCQNLIKPAEKKISYKSINEQMHYFHQRCYNSLLGPKIGGRQHSLKVDRLVNKQDWNNHRREEKKEWNQESSNQKPSRYTRKAPKAHVTKFNPSTDQKAQHLQLLIETIRQQNKPLTSEELAQLTQIKRSTITFRLWENTKGYPQAKDHIFYIAERGPRGVQYYDLLENLKEEKN